MQQITKNYFVEKIGDKFPPETIDFVYDIFSNEKFSLKSTAPRASKKGDFRYFPNTGKSPVISINGDLCTYEFLLVFLHEVAHYNLYAKRIIRNVPSHGVEWKVEYFNLIQQLLTTCALPDDIAETFEKYTRNIKSSSAFDMDLETVFQKYRTHSDESLTNLNQLKVGDKFIFKRDIFELNEFLRTRTICTNLRSNRKFYIHGAAYVKKIGK